MDNGGDFFGVNGKPESQFRIGKRLVWLDYDAAKRLKQQEKDGTLDSWWYEEAADD